MCQPLLYDLELNGAQKKEMPISEEIVNYAKDKRIRNFMTENCKDKRAFH